MIKLIDLLKEDNFFGLKVGDEVKFKDINDGAGYKDISTIKYGVNPKTTFKITFLYPGDPDTPNPNTHADLKDNFGNQTKKVYTGYLKKDKIDEKLDPVGKEDADIDNDGDEDKTDKYLLKRRKAISSNIKEGDHEVSMAQASLKSIIKSSVTLLNKLGNEERNIPGWIQDHITNAENYIDQAAQGFHELHHDE
jgi:hypothetical protein